MDIANNLSLVLKPENGLDEFPLIVPINTQSDTLCFLLNELRGKSQVAERVWYKFYLGKKEARGRLSGYLSPEQFKNPKQAIHITYVEQPPFMVRPVTRCTSSLLGHAATVMFATFSPDSRVLATGSGDNIVHLWDTDSQTPLREAKGHRHWVLCLAWAPDGRRLVSGDLTGVLIIWDAATQQDKTLSAGHNKWITSLAWEPYHVDSECRHVASSTHDGEVRIWDTWTLTCVRTLAGHQGRVSCVRWGGAGLLYTASHDQTVRVWRATDGVLARVLVGHTNWVSTLALSTEWVIKCGPFHPNPDRKSKGQELAASRYEEVRRGREWLVSTSEDCTMLLWSPELSDEPVRQLTGHRQVINDVKFSPDARVFASACFDKTIRLWAGLTGDLLGVLRGHAQSVFALAWSPDSRRVVSGSEDATLKVWDVGAKCLEVELPGHAGEVFTLDWCLDGSKVASGGKDKLIKLWQA